MGGLSLDRLRAAQDACSPSTGKLEHANIHTQSTDVAARSGQSLPVLHTRGIYFSSMGILGCELRCVLRTAIATCKFTKIYPLVRPTRHVAHRELAQFCARHLYPMARLEFGDCEIPIVPAKVARTAFHIINIISSYSSALRAV